MIVLFVAPPDVGLLGEKGGVFREMKQRALSLEVLGHKVEFLNIWEEPKWKRYDLCHLFMANGDSFNLGIRIAQKLPLVVSPIIDRVKASPILRLTVLLDMWIPKIYTHVGRCAMLCNKASLVIARSHEEQILLQKGFGVYEKTYISLCPIQIPYNFNPLEKLEKISPRPTLLFIGDMNNQRKNIMRLVKAVKSIDCMLYLVGSLPMGKKLIKLREECEKSKNIHIVGTVNENKKQFLLKNCDVFVLPSLVEGIGLAALEAGFWGKTVVITKNGGAVDYFADKAYYVDPMSIKSIHDGILDAIRHPKNPKNILQRKLNLKNLGEILLKGYRLAMQNIAIT